MNYLFDTDFLISLHFPLESTHQRARKLALKHLEHQESTFTDLVLMECATVVSRKYNQQSALLLARQLRANPQGSLTVSEKLIQQTWELFDQQKMNGTSLIDCSNVVVARSLGCHIISFDKFYQQFGLLVTV